MNDNIICAPEGAEVRMVDGKFEYYADGIKLDRFALLAAAYENEDKNKSWEILHSASCYFHWQDDAVFNTLYYAVAMGTTMNHHKTEFDIHVKFCEAVSDLFSGEAKVIKQKNDLKHQPDVWLSVRGKRVPVEVKKGAFGEKAMAQLNRYINFYGCKSGIAVGKNITAAIPENVRFISISEFM